MRVNFTLVAGSLFTILVTLIVIIISIPGSPYRFWEKLNDRKLIFFIGTNDNKIQLYDFESKTMSDLLVDQVNGIEAFAPFPDGTLCYGTRKSNDPIHSLVPKHKSQFYHTKNWTKTAMAVDYVTDKIYILDGVSKKVYLIDTHTDYYYTVLSDLNDPKDIVVQLGNTELFILESSSISRASITHPKVVIVEHPNLLAFTVDFSKQIVYYSDGNRIRSRAYSGWKKEISYKIKNVISLTVANNYLFFIKRQTNSANRILKACYMNGNGSCKTEELQVSPHLEKIQYFNVNSPDFVNHCNVDYTCDQICTTRAGLCGCTDGWRLEENYKCFPSDKLYVNVDSKYIAEFNLKDNCLADHLLRSDWGIKSFDLYDNNQAIYATENPDKPILCTDNTCRLSEITENWITSGLTVDIASKNVYITDVVNGNLNVARINTKGAKVLISGLEKPKNVVLDPESGLMFIQGASSVLQANMDGTSLRMIYKKAGLSATAVDTRNKKLYIAVPKAILCIDYKTDERYKITNLDNTEVLSLAVLNGDLFALMENDFIKRSIQQCHLTSNPFECTFTVIYENDLIVDIKSALSNN